MFLLDTMVISEGRRTRPSQSLSDWLASAVPSQLFVSAISFGEISAGIEKQRTTNPEFSDLLDRWFAATRKLYGDRTLPIDMEIALRWGRLYMRLGRRDMDLLIAATALHHDLTVVTRNVRHFEPTGVKLLNPYET